MRRRIPSLSALVAFEAAARHRSFTRASEELLLTQGAISRQVQALEEQLGLALFHRSGRQVMLTAAGAAYAARLAPLLDRLEAVTEELEAFQGAGGVLNLALLPTFGLRWLIPRLPGFTAGHPEIGVNISTRLDVFDFAREEIDAAVHYGDEVWPGGELERLRDEVVEVVCSPALATKAALAAPSGLRRQTLLQLAPRPHGWEDWLRGVGESAVDARRGPRFPHHSMIIQAAIAGLGFAVLPTFFIEEELRDGRLVRPFPHLPVRSERAYWLVWPPEKRDYPPLVAFREWLRAEVRCALEKQPAAPAPKPPRSKPRKRR